MSSDLITPLLPLFRATVAVVIIGSGLLLNSAYVWSDESAPVSRAGIPVLDCANLDANECALCSDELDARPIEIAPIRRSIRTRMVAASISRAF